MAAPHPRATLIHNEKAGDRRHCRAGLVELLGRAGYRVDYFSAKERDIAAVVERPADLVVAAGGDGTVAKVVAAATPEGPPIAILPLGTANNIARSLGIEGPLDDIVAVWAARKMRPLYPITADGPWGSRRLAEGIGFGAIEQAMHQMPHKPGLKRARQAIRAAVLGAPSESLEIGIGGEAIAGRFAVVEIAAIRLIGPRLPLAPAADPSDRSLDICFIGDSGEERQRLARWLDDPEGAGPAPASARRGERVTIRGQFRCVRLDSKLWSGEPDPRAGDPRPAIHLATEPRPLHFLVPG
jgi:diacylglycerol kinase (ATP)